jgi:excisionase family DNA binding protein
MHFGNNLKDRVLRVRTVAKLSGYSERTIRRRIQNHEIPASRIGRRAWGIRFSDLGRDHEAHGGDHAGN